MKPKANMRNPVNFCGIGVDIEDIARFRKVLSNKGFMFKVFTEKEIKYCRRFSSPEMYLAARFAGKEAVFKALSGNNGADKKVAFSEIEILNRKDGSPFVNIKISPLKNRFDYFISLSHSKTKAMAFSVITRKV